MSNAEKLTFKTVDAISVGGSYVVGADGAATRQHEESTSLESIAKGAPGQAAGAAADGVAPAHTEAAESVAAPKPPAGKAKA